MFTNGKHFSQWAAIAVATILLSAWEAQAQKPPKPSDGSKLSFTTYDLHPGSPYLKSEARGLNDFGVTVGLAGAWDLYDETDWTRAMCWRLSNGTVISQALDEGDALPGTTSATAVNSGGAIAGMGEYVVEVPDLEGGSSDWPLYQGMYWSSADATPIRLGTPLGYHTCLPTAMNDDGVIVGVAYQLAAGPDYLAIAEATAVAWRVVDGEVSDVKTLGPLDIDDTSFAQGVNNTVEDVCLIVGNSLFGRRTEDGFLTQWIKWAFPRFQYFSTAVTWAVTLEEDGTLDVSGPNEIATPGDGRYSFGFGINDLGEACGVATEGGVYLTTYLGYAGAQPLAKLPDTYFINYSVHDINLPGEAVGCLQDATTTYIDAVIWVGGSPTKLYSFIGKGKSTFSRFYMAYKINTRGDIVGYGWTKSGSHGFLMIRK